MQLIGKTLAVAALLAAGLSAQSVVGIPVDHALTVQKCGGCHKMDEHNMMGRVSYMRTTPEIWQEIIKRMMRLNGVVATPGEVRDIVRYLSNNNGLAPEEMKPAFWDVEHRAPGHQFDFVPDQAIQKTCNYCHTIGRVLAQRRTADDYAKLASMHTGLFPGAENVFRPRHAPVNVDETPIQLVAGTNGSGNPSLAPDPAPAASSGKYPIDDALAYLAKAQPLITPEWTAWKAAMRSPNLAGKWALSGYQVGKGKVYGIMTVKATAAADEFETSVELSYANTGATFSRSGKGVVYTGYSWRGRQTAASKPAANADPGNAPAEWREAMMLSRDNNSMTGRWFWGGYEEFGIDVALTRAGKEPVVLGTDLYALQMSTTKELKIFGANFPQALKPAEIDLGPGVTVKRIVSATPTLVIAEVAAAAGLPVGLRDVTVAGASALKAITIYDKVSYVKVAPSGAMARLGGTIAPKQYMQFEAIAYANGPDGKPNTADDLALGPVTAAWSLEEFYSTPDDDDVKYVGQISDSGLFTPAAEGPNPARQKQANNYPTNNWGDVWVNATYRDGEKPMQARSYLVVTIPMYVRYDQPEVSK
jgi:quinohemoprotein amine dehydrogenase